MNRFAITCLMALGALSAGVVAYDVAHAQNSDRPPEYQQARTAKVIGEQMDGYLGFVVTPSDSVRAMVRDLNNRRKEKYTKGALEGNSTVQEMAFTTGCRLIAGTEVGEMYQAPDGSWQERTSAPPIRNARCPQ